MGFRTNLLKFDKNNCPENFTFILANKSLTHLGQLHNVEESSVHYVGNLNGADEISLKVYKTINDEVESHWNDIVDFKTLYVVEVGEYFEIKVSLDDEKNGYKTLTCTSLCEAELSNLNLYDIEINTDNEADIINSNISAEEYEATIFYNEENPNKSLLHRVLKDKAPHYTIKHVDDSLKKLQRSFSINGTSIYSFLTGECAEQFNCMFVFNSPDRSISVYDLYTVCNGCGYRGAYSDVCPECGSDFLNYFGEDTTVYIDKENFAENIKFEVDADSVKNCFRLVAGDDIMTDTVRSLNQNGSNYIYYITEDTKKDMSSELVEKLDNYDELYDSYTEEYQQLLEDYYKAVDDKLYYESSMMPEKPSDDEDIDNEISIANQEIIKLTSEKMSPMGVVNITNITTSTSFSTINNAVENYAKVFVNTSLVKIKVTEGAFTYKGKESGTDFDYGEWTGTIQLTNYSDEEDIATTTLTLTVHDNYADFAQQKVMKEIASDDEDHSIYDVISIENLDEFKEALTYYSLNRLKSFEIAIETALDTLIGINQGSKDAETYDVFYVPYCDKRDACFAEKEIRQATIDGIEEQKNTILNRMTEIQETLNFENYLGLELYKEFSSYRREQEYSNSNYISDGLNNAERITNAKEFIDAAKKELYKSATKQGHISTDLYNLLAMEEFKPLVEKFALGNFIRVKADETIYRLRLIKFEINFSDLTKLPVEFSDMTVSADGFNDVKSILSAAQDMSKTYSYTSKQAEKGQIANSTFEQMYQDGLNSALYNIINSPKQTVGMNQFGLWAKAWDDIENDYSQEQARFTNNILAYTTDNWRSVETGLGKHNYWRFDNDGEKRQYTGYGLSAKFLTAPFINNAQFIGGEIYSNNYKRDNDGNVVEGSYFNLNDGHFTFGGGSLTYNETDGLYVNGNGTFTGVIKANGGQIGNLTINNYGWLTHSSNNHTVTLRGVQDDLTRGVFYITDPDGKYPFFVSGDGSFTATKATLTGADVSGKITASSGFITGNLDIGGSLTNTKNGYTVTLRGVQSSTSYGVFYITDNSDNSNPFRVNGDGSFVATKATIKGTITADGGKIGNLNINENGWLTHSSNNHTVTLRGVQSNTSYGVFYITDSDGEYPFLLAGDGSFTATKANITGILHAGENSSLGNMKVDNNSIFFGTWSSPNAPTVFMCTGSNKSSYTIGGYSTSNWAFGTGNTFGVTTDGAVYCGGGNSETNPRFRITYDNQYFSNLAAYSISFTTNGGQGCNASLGRNGLEVHDTYIDASGNIFVHGTPLSTYIKSFL